jgi:hypothetical protein
MGRSAGGPRTELIAVATYGVSFVFAMVLLRSAVPSESGRWGVASAIATAITAAIVLGIPAARSLREARQTELQAKDAAEHALVPEKTLDQRLDQLSASLAESARLVEQVTAELDAQAATARRLTREAADAEAIAAIHKEQTEAVRRLLNSEMTAQLTKTERNIFRDSLRIAIGSFIFGGALTFVVTLLVHPLS